MSAAVDDQAYGGEQTDRWLALLLGCASLADRVEEAVAAALEGAVQGGPGARQPPDREAALALDALLGIVAMKARFEELLAPRVVAPRDADPAGPRPRGDLFR